MEREREAAYLRLLFNEVAEMQDEWRKNPMIVWNRLYEGIRDTLGGLEVLQHIRRQEEDITRLQKEVDRLNTQLVMTRKPPMVK